MPWALNLIIVFALGDSDAINLGASSGDAWEGITIITSIILQHDPAGECSPGPPDGNYIMYASATDGNRKEFSPCSRESMGRTIEANGGCFVQRM